MKKFISIMAAALLLVSCTSPANDNDSEDAVVAETSAEAAPETAEEEVTFTAGGTSPYTGREIITHTYAYSLLTDEQKSIYDKLLNACLNFDEAVCPKEIEQQSVCIQADAGEILRMLR